MTLNKLILEIGAEGGSITLFRVEKSTEIRFVVNTKESDLDDNFYHSEKSFNTLNDAVKYLYLKYPILDLYLVRFELEYILPIAAIIKENTHLRNMEYDPVEAEANDQAIKKNIGKTTPEKWKDLGDQVINIRELLGKEMSGNKTDSLKTDQAIFHMHGLVHEVNIVNPFNWPYWDEGRWLLKAPGTDFYQLETVTLCKLVTAIIRKDRFCEGAWDCSFRDNSMLKVIDAIVQKNLHRE